MQFHITKSLLSASLGLVNNVTDKRHVIPILKNIKIDVFGDNLKISATDMDILSESVIKISNGKDGTTTISAQLFYDIIRKVPDDQNIIVLLEDDQKSIKISYAKSKFFIPCLNADEFPILGDDNMDIEFEMPASELASLIDKTKFAMAIDETRHYINGIFLHSEEKDGIILIKSVATDSHRLAVASSHLSTLKTTIPGVIIPRKTVHEIRKIIEFAKDVKIMLSKAKIKIIFENNVLISKLVNADFPDYNIIIPRDNQNIATIDKKQFYESIDRVATIIDYKDSRKTIKLDFQNNKLEVFAETNNGSFANEELDILYDGDKTEIPFNAQYLLDILNNIKSDKIDLKIKNNSTSVLICEKKLDGTCTDDIYAILPLRY